MIFYATIIAPGSIVEVNGQRGVIEMDYGDDDIYITIDGVTTKERRQDVVVSVAEVQPAGRYYCSVCEVWTQDGGDGYPECGCS